MIAYNYTYVNKTISNDSDTLHLMTASFLKKQTVSSTAKTVP